MSSPSSPDENVNDVLLEIDELLLHADARVIAERGTPPAELLTEIGAAAVRERRLRDGGRQLRFYSPMDGPLRIELCGVSGEHMRACSTAEAFALACGEGAR
ncbi:MAG TPA: hypothetical protein VGG08_08690 [Solirubrobacteraceae bacterium]|jgi:hypothetical protein